jgi:predicted RNase H-like HicB family nuclease
MNQKQRQWAEKVAEFHKRVLDRLQSDESFFLPQYKDTRYPNVKLEIETEQETDGRWLAEVPALPGAMVYGQTREEAITRVEAIALRVIADRLEHGETIPEVTSAFLVVA